MGLENAELFVLTQRCRCIYVSLTFRPKINPSYSNLTAVVILQTLTSHRTSTVSPPPSGLEPEIQKLISKHKQELKKLRTLHEAELLQADDRAAQRYVRQCEELRQQLEREKEEQCQRERELAKQRYACHIIITHTGLLCRSTYIYYYTTLLLLHCSIIVYFIDTWSTNKLHRWQLPTGYKNKM